MQPKPITPGFITTPHRRLERQAEPRLRTSASPAQARGRSPAAITRTRGALRRRRRKPQRPFRTAQLERHVQRRRLCITLGRAGRRSHQLLLFVPASTLSELTAAARLSSLAPRRRGTYIASISWFPIGTNRNRPTTPASPARASPARGAYAGWTASRGSGRSSIVRQTR